MQIIKKTHFDFIGKKKITFTISTIIAIIGIVAIVQIARGSANLGIDFTGGTALQLMFEKPVSLQEARKALTKNGLDVSLQEITDGNKLLIRVGKTTLATGNVAAAVENVFKKEFSTNPFIVESSTEIGPSIGEKLRKDTLIAIVVAMIGIIIYIAWRFDLKFGIAAALATFHDVLAILAIFYLLDKEINLLLVTAILTIAGYSLTDTVVVFDRIRENLHKNTKDSLASLFNSSINETLSRTFITGLTTLFATLSLYLLGGTVIHDFSFALVVGIVVGTYSSVFVASPLVLLWENRALRAKA
ncbi:MAG: protein translocase subunit SecF [Deltaproteobacteria bacterium]|nr:protein translocase subunit SecF [Deltaproteobacteria bacterium]TLN04530.1 MAG: protein translocase subunit SecF [bacterium]